jgi:hypothetical protein
VEAGHAPDARGIEGFNHPLRRFRPDDSPDHLHYRSTPFQRETICEPGKSRTTSFLVAFLS